MESSVDLEGDGSGYSGTFRWKASKKLNSLPPTTKNRKSLDYSNWMKYFVSRSDSDKDAGALIQMVQGDLSIIDCLSTPLSICHLFDNTLFKISTRKTFYKKLSVVCLGCSSKAEERVLLETNCFLELCYYFYNIQHIDLWLVGPEMSTTSEGFTSHKNIVKNQILTCSLFQGTSMQFFRSFPSYLNKSTVVVGFNCGFGNYENNTSIRYNLLLNWLPDLYFLTGTNLPLLFTCANDYADLNGEVRVMLNLLGANLVLTPGENPFSYASTLIPPNSTNSNNNNANEFSRGNSFCYAVQGHTKSRRHKISFSEGLKCIPSFLELFRVTLPPLDQCTVSCTLELEEIGKAVSVTTAVANCSLAPAVTDKETVIATADPEPSFIDTVISAESIPVSTSSSDKVKTVICESASSNTNVESDNGGVSESKQYAIKQSVVDHRLTVTIAVCPSSSSGGVDLTQADLRISEDGRLLHFSLLPAADTSGVNAGSTAVAGVDVIELSALVNHFTMKAKYSKKLLTLTVTADIK